MKRTGHELNKKILLDFLAGHRRANEFIKEEKRRQLPQLTAEDSLIQYDSVCQIGEAISKKEGSAVLEKQRIKFLVDRRSLMNLLGKNR